MHRGAMGRRKREVRYLAYDAQTPTPRARCTRSRSSRSGAPTIVHRSDGLLGQPLGPFLELLRRGAAPTSCCSSRRALATPNAWGRPRSGCSAWRSSIRPTRGSGWRACACSVRVRSSESLWSAMRPHWTGVLRGGGARVGGLAESLIAREAARPQVRVVREWHAFAGEALDLLDMNRAVLDGLEHQVSALQRDGNRFEGRVFIDATASVTSSVICGPVIVGAGAHVADSYIGPHTSIGERVHVEGVEDRALDRLRGSQHHPRGWAPGGRASWAARHGSSGTSRCRGRCACRWRTGTRSRSAESRTAATSRPRPRGSPSPASARRCRSRALGRISGCRPRRCPTRW